MDPIQFVPVMDFPSEEFKSLYVQGLVYTIRPGNERLLKAARKWKDEGKVRFLGEKTEQPAATMKGQGTVK